MATIAPMDLAVKVEPLSIPLKCTLCPRKPNFSDVSHLLTHISSKSHLSHRFKAELRSHKEREAQEAIRQYDDWYERHGIRALLAERMIAKEQKKTGKRGRPLNTTDKTRTAPKNDDLIKAEPGDLAEPTPMIAHWPTNSHTTLQLPSIRYGYFDGSGYQTPLLKRTPSDYSVPGSPDNMIRIKYRRWPSETETTESAPVSELPSEITEFADDEDEASKLKGIRYPGMGLFDSASELQKKKRNQRKDNSVVKQIEQASSGIEPTEFVWSEDGEFQRTRDIYASPSVEGSPERKLDVDNHKKKRGRRPAVTVVTDKPRQTRFSTRIAQHKAAVKCKSTDDEDVIFDQGNHDASQISSHSHGSMESYDVFQDHSQPVRDHTESPAEDTSLETRRPALQPMSSNVTVAAETAKPTKSLPYYSARDNSPTSFQPHAYFQHQHNFGGGTLNPLYIQTRNGYFHPYSYSSYGTELKPPPPGFQPINSSMNQMSGGVPFNSFTAAYAPDSTHQRGPTDFDI